MLMLEINRAPESEAQDVVKFLTPWDYRPYYYADGRLQRFDGRADPLPAHNFFFLTPVHIKAISARIAVACAVS